MTRTATVLRVGPERGLSAAFEAAPRLDVRVLTVPRVEHVSQTLAAVDADVLVVPDDERAAVAGEQRPTVYVTDDSLSVSEVSLTDDSTWWHAALTTRIEAVLSKRHAVAPDVANRVVADAYGSNEYPSRGAIGRRAVATVTDAFALPHAAVALLDEEEGVLSTVAMSPATRAAAADTDSFGPDDRCVWRAFSKAETTLVSESETPAGATCALVTPLGESGVLIAGTSHATDITEQTVDALELLATTTRLALDRQRAAHDREEAEQQLEEQRERLERVVDINDKVRKMDQALVRAETRAEVERSVCERLLTSDRFAFAWVGEPDGDGTAVQPRSIAGTGQGYLDSVSLSLEEDPAEPALRALETGEVTIVSHVSGRELHEQRWREEALLRDFRSVASIPLVHGEVTYGVVTVYASVPAAFDTLAVSVLSEMGETIGYAIDAAEQRLALNSDVVTELTLTLPAPDDVFTRLTSQFDSPFVVDGLAARADEATLVYGTLPDAPPDDVLATAAASPAVETVRAMSDSDDRFEFVVVGTPLPVLLADLGTTPTRFSSVGEQVTTTVTLPDQTSVRTVVDRLASTYGGATVQAQRTRERSSSPLARAVAALTDRQREVFETAYYSGYFEWPREQTGEEIADTLGISQPAFLQHLRACERKFAANVCERD